MDEAIENYTKVIEINPNGPGIQYLYHEARFTKYYDLPEMAFKKNEMGKALQLFNLVLSILRAFGQ